jgi:hypothetical protein
MQKESMTTLPNKADSLNRLANPTNGTGNVQADLFENLEALRLPQDYTKHTAKTVITNVPVRKPSPDWWFRVHADPSFEMRIGLLELKDERNETYLVMPTLLPALATEGTVSPRLLTAAVTRQGTAFLWPLRLPSGDRDEPWATSALEVAAAARENWVRMQWSNQQKSYTYQIATAVVSDPVWPDMSFNAMLRRAFENRTITDLEHPVLRRLRGEV